MQKYILALDQGTTSSRAILFNRAGDVCGIAQQEFGQIFPQPGWVEHNPTEIWQSQLAVAREVLRTTHVHAKEIAAIGIANQRETTVLWDRITGEPAANAIVWQDRRTADLCDALRAQGHAELITSKTGLVIDAYFSGTKLQWLLDHVPGARERANRGELAFGTIDAWLAYKLCGRHVCDTSNASRTLLFNIHTLQWDDELLALFNIPRAVLPQVTPSSGVIGHSASHLLGASIPIAGLAGDQQAAMFGQACVHAGMAKNTYGTGCFMLLNTGKEVVSSGNNLLTTVGWSLEANQESSTNYMIEGSVFMAGATIQWLRDGLQLIHHVDEVETLASAVQDSGGVVLVPAFAGLGAPYWDPDARGTMIGMTRGTSKSHIARAALESIAYQTADILQAMQADAGTALSELRVDGGAARNDLLLQFQADILNVPVLRPVITETTALGAAYLAGLAIGFWESIEQIASHWKLQRRFEPQSTASQREGLLHNWHRAIERSRSWIER